MSGQGEPMVLALLVRSLPFQRRSARAELDVAMSALLLDLRVEVYFIGASVWQLADSRDAKAAGLHAAYRGWTALPDLGELKVFAEKRFLEQLQRQAVNTHLPLIGLEPEGISRRWRAADYSMVV